MSARHRGRRRAQRADPTSRLTLTAVALGTLATLGGCDLIQMVGGMGG